LRALAVKDYGRSRTRTEEKKFEGKSKIIVNIDTIHCADCALNIERSVEHLPGILLLK
jgi:hypothetical protein